MFPFNRRLSFICNVFFHIPLRSFFLFIFLVVTACAVGPGVEAPVSDVAHTKTPEIDALIDELFEAQGVDLLVEMLDEIIQKEIGKMLEISMLDKEVIEKYRRTFRGSFEPKAIRRTFRDKVASDLSESELRSILDWLHSARGRRIEQEERAVISIEAIEAERQFSLDIGNLQISDVRMDSLRRMKQASGVVEFEFNLLRMMENLGASMAAGGDAEKRKQLLAGVRDKYSKKEQEIKQGIENRTITRSIFTYRNVSDEDLSTYVVVQEGDAFRKFNAALFTAMTDIMSGFAEEIFKTFERAAMKGEWMVFEDLNFKFRRPGAPWVSMDVKKIHPKAALCLSRNKPEQYIIVIGEKLGVDKLPDASALVEISQANVRHVHKHATFTPGERLTTNGLPGIRFEYKATTSSGVSLFYDYWDCLYNGYAHQVITWGLAENSDQVRREFDVLLKGFAPVDPDRVYHGKGAPYGEFVSPHLGYRIDLAHTDWERIADVRTMLEEAETGGVGGDAWFVVVPVLYPGMRPSLEALVGCLGKITSLDIDKNRLIDYRRFAEGDVAGCTFGLKDDTDGKQNWRRIKALAGADAGVLIIVSSGSDARTAKLADHVFKGFHWSGETSDVPALDRLPEGSRKKQAHLLNALGLYYHDMRQHPRALQYFNAAAALDPKDADYIENTARSYTKVDRIEEGLAFLERHLSHHEGNTGVVSWKAWMLKELKRDDEALALYSDMFARGHENEHDFSDYIDLLCEKERWKEAEQAVDRFLEKVDNLKVRLEKVDVYYLQGRFQDAVTLLNGLKSGNPPNSEIFFRLIRNYRAMSQPRAVIAVADEMIEEEMHPADAYYYRGEAEHRLKWHRRAMESLEKGLALDPDDEATRELMREVSAAMGKGDASAIKTPIPPAPLPEELKALLPPRSDDPGEKGYGAVHLYDIKGLSFEKGGEEKITTYSRVKINDMTGVSRFSTFEIHFNPVHEDVHVNELIVWDENGEEAARGSIDEYFVLDRKDRAMVTYEKTLSIPVPNLKPGYGVDLVYTIRQKGRAGALNFFSHCLSGYRPKMVSAVFFRGDPRSIRHVGQSIPSARPYDDGLIWMMREPPVYAWEPSQAPWDSWLPLVSISDAGRTWDGLAGDYLASIGDATAPDETIRRLAAELTGGVDDPRGKFIRIVQHVQQNYTYKPIEFGVRGRIPRLPSETMNKRYGDCKDFSILVHALLSAVDIEAHPALVNTQGKIRPELPSMDQFNHMILYVDIDGGRFLDPTDRALDPRVTIPSDLAGKKALVLKQDASVFCEIPAYAPLSNTLVHRSKITASAPGDTMFKDRVGLKGYAAAFLRDHFLSMDAVSYKEWGRELLSQYLPDASLLDFNLENLHDSTRELRVELHYVTKSPWLDNGTHRLFSAPSVWTEYYLRPEASRDRKSDFVINYPFMMESHMEIELPEGLAFEEAGEPTGGEAGPFGGWEQHTTRGARVLQRRFSCRLKRGRHPPDQYKQYEQFLDNGLKAARPLMRCRVKE